MSEIADTRENINDGKLDFDTHVTLNTDALEAFFRSMLKPVNDNETDINKKNIIVSENFSFEPLKRLYFQDLYKSLMADEELYDLISVNAVNNTFPGPKVGNTNTTMEVVGNAVTIQGHTDIGDLDTAINNTVGETALGQVEIANSSFHSAIEFANSASTRKFGLYDAQKLKDVNASGDLFAGLGLLEQVFDDEEAFLKEDIKKENNLVSLQTIARRMVELFARLSNIRLSMLFWTDKVNNYQKEWATAALDIFYNLMSRMSEAHRINIPREHFGTVTKSRVEISTVTETDSRVLDVLFWIDVSPSMHRIIGAVVDSLDAMLTTIKSKNANCKIGLVEGPSVLGAKAKLVCNFTANMKVVKACLNKLRDTDHKYGSGNEGVSGLMNVMWGKILYDKDCLFCYENANKEPVISQKKDGHEFVWEKKAKRIVIVFSDEPVDNYTSISATRERVHHPNSVKNEWNDDKWAYKQRNDGSELRNFWGLTKDQAIDWERVYYQDGNPPWRGDPNYNDLNYDNRRKDDSSKRVTVTEFDGTTYKYYCNPKEGGAWQTYRPADEANWPPNVTSNEAWITCHDWQFNNSWWHHDIQGSHGDSHGSTFTGQSWWKHWKNSVESVAKAFSKDATPTTGKYNGMTDSWGINCDASHAVVNTIHQMEFTRSHFVNAFINPGLNVWQSGFNPTQEQIQKAQDNITELHWVYLNEGNVSTIERKPIIDRFKRLIQYNILRPIAKANGGFANGGTIHEIPAADSGAMANALIKVFNERTYTRTYTVKKTITWEEADTSWASHVIKYARASRLNKTYADMMRPCVFVPNLVSTMMMIVQSRKYPDGQTGDSGWPAWNTLLSQVQDKEDGNYTWFGRSNELKKDGSGNPYLLQGGMYSDWTTGDQAFHALQNEALNRGGDYAESLTGIHLKLLNPNATETSIDNALSKGLEILADAFEECFNDAEVLKCLNMGTNPPTPTNMWKLMHDQPGSMANIGDLQCSLILERIIAKIYSELNVKGCSYFKAKNPHLNLDFALRFLTDATFANNELEARDSTKYRVAYSNVLDYVKRVASDVTTYDSFDPDSKYILEHVVTTTDDIPVFSKEATYSVGALCRYEDVVYKCTTAITTAGEWDFSKWTKDPTRSINSSFKYLTQDWSLCPYRFSNPTSSTSVRHSGEHEVGGADSNYSVSYSANPENPVCPFAGLDGVYLPVVHFGAGSSIKTSNNTVVKTWDEDLQLDFTSSEPVDGVRTLTIQEGDQTNRYTLKQGEDANHWILDLYAPSSAQTPTFSFNVIITQVNNPIALTTTGYVLSQKDVFVDSNPHGCKLRYVYSSTVLASLEDNLKKIPPTCPCRSLANKLLYDISVSKTLPAPDEMDSRKYIHTLFKDVTDDKQSLIDTKDEEARSMGWDSSVDIINNHLAPQLPPTYQDEYHSNVRLVYLDQLIRLCKDLFRFNMNLAFDEPYLKTKVNKAKEHYYGSETHGSFEPITCYRFSNFHAMNDYDTRSAANRTYKLKVYARSLNGQHVTAVNRDLSGETAFNNNIWSRTEVLDNNRTVLRDDGSSTGVLESKNTYPYYQAYAHIKDTGDVDENRFIFTASEIKSGIIDPAIDNPQAANPRNKDICRGSSADGYKLYAIHLMDELVGIVKDDNHGSNKTSSLTTLEVWVKRFRPIFLPNAEDLFKSDDRDPLDPSNTSKSAKAMGWSITPHKYSADVHFSKDAIIIPMNLTSRNSPRSGWFNELDYDFHKAHKQGTVVISGYYDEANDQVLQKAGPADASGATTLQPDSNGREAIDMCLYHYRDWLYPVSMIDHLHVSGDNGALLVIPDSAKARIKDENPKDGANDYTQGQCGAIPIYKSGDQVSLSVSQDNLRAFDILKQVDTHSQVELDEDKQRTALNANWLYITTQAPGAGVETSQCLYPLPWVFFHSSRGDQGAGPSNWYHGMGNKVTQNHESGFWDENPYGMRFFAVDSVLAQDPVHMKLAGTDVDVEARASLFYKGFYDPSCAGTTTKWATHGSAYYGWPNGSSNKNGPRPDKYQNPYNSAGNHVLVGDSLNSVTSPNGMFDGNAAAGGNGTDYNVIIRKTIKDKPMTWSLWNVLRQSIYYCYNVEDLDYDKDRIGCTIDRKQLGASIEEVELKTSKSIREMYREWYNRFTYGGKYTSRAGSGGEEIAGTTPWPYKKSDDDPSNYWQAQRLLKGASEAVDGGVCNIEWTNLVADIAIIYNEVSDTHDSCLTMYTGGHPSYSAYVTDQVNGEFRGKTTSNTGQSGVFDNSISPSWAQKVNQYPGFSNSVPFRYALSGVDMCRNFMALTYRGYNSSVPDTAFGHDGHFNQTRGKFQPHSTHPKNLLVSREIRTVNVNGQVITRSTQTDNGTQIDDTNKLLKDIYPPSEEDDTEGCDMNFLQRLLLPCYPNWEDLHDDHGLPLSPDAVSDDDFKKIVFCLVPVTYYHGLAAGNGSNKKDKKKKKDGEIEVEEETEEEIEEDMIAGMEVRGKKKKNSSPAQVGERMMAFCVAEFFTGEEAEKLTSTLDTEFFAKVAAPNVSVISTDLGHDYKPGDPPWGQALATAGNWDPSHWKILA